MARPFLLFLPLLVLFLSIFSRLLYVFVQGSSSECPDTWITALQPLSLVGHDMKIYPPGNGGTINDRGTTLLPATLSTDQSVGAYWILKEGEGHAAGGFRITFQVKVSALSPPQRDMAGFAIILYDGRSIDDEYNKTISPLHDMTTADVSQLGFHSLPSSIAIEVDFQKDGGWDGPVPHLSIHSSSYGGNDAIYKISSDPLFTGDPTQTNLMTVQFDPVTKLLTAELGANIVVAKIDPNSGPYFGNSNYQLRAVGFTAAKYAYAPGQISITNLQMNFLPFSYTRSELDVASNGTFSSLTTWSVEPQAIFYYRDICGTSMTPPLSMQAVNIFIKNSTGQLILTGPDGNIQWFVGGDRIMIYFYMKHSALKAGFPQSASLFVTMNNVLWSVVPNITFVRVPPSPSVSTLVGPTIIPIGVPQMFTLTLFDAIGLPAVYDSSSTPISYGLEVGGWVEQTATLNLADPTIVYLPLAPLRFYPDQLQTNLYIKFNSTKVKWSPVNLTLNYVFGPPKTCLQVNYLPLDSKRDYIYGNHSGVDSSGFIISLFPNIASSSKPSKDVWIGSAWLRQPYYLGNGFTWTFTTSNCDPMAAVLFAGDHPPNASDYTPMSYGQDLTAPLGGYGWRGLNNTMAIEFSPNTYNSSQCDFNIWRTNSADPMNPIRLYYTTLTSPALQTYFVVEFDSQAQQLSMIAWAGSVGSPAYIYPAVNHAFITQSPSVCLGFVAATNDKSKPTTLAYPPPMLSIIPPGPSLSYILFTQNNTLTYVAQAEHSIQPQALLQLVDVCGKLTLQAGMNVQVTIIDPTSSTRVIQTKVVYTKQGQYQLFWFTRGVDQSFQANLNVTVNGVPIKNTAITLTFIPSVPVKEHSTLPPNIPTMIAGVSYSFELILRDQFTNLALYDPTRVMFSYGVLGQILTNVTQVNSTSPSKVQFSFSVSQISAVNPITFIIKYGSDVWSSYEVLIVSADADPAQTQFSSLASTQLVESSQSLVISIFDKYKNPVPANIASIYFVFRFESSQHPSGLSAFTHGVRPSGSLVYSGFSNNATLILTSNVAGNHSLLVYVKDQLQLTLTIFVLVQPNVVPVSSGVVSLMQSINSSRTDLQPSFILDLFDAYLNPLSNRASSSLFEVELEHTSPQRSDVKTSTQCLPYLNLPVPTSSSPYIQVWCVWDDVSLGYSVSVTASIAGQYRATSKSPNNVMNVSTSFLTVIPGPISASRSSVQLTNSTFAAGTFPLTMTLRDALGQGRFDTDDSAAIELRLISSRNGEILNGIMVPIIGSATYRVTNTPKQVGSYLLSILVAKQLMSLTSEQVKITIIPAQLNVSRTIFSLSTISSTVVTATQPFNFTLITRDSYDNQLDRGGAKIQLVGFTSINNESGTNSTSTGSSGSSSAMNNNATGSSSNSSSSSMGASSRRLLTTVNENTYSVTDHDDGTYTIVVTFSNSKANTADPLQPLINGAPAVATPPIVVQPADPCLFTPLTLRTCGESKKCVSTFNPYTSNYTHECISIMTITSITPLVTGTNGGGAPITITLSQAPDLGKPVIISVRGPSHFFHANSTQQPYQFTFFLPPALQLGYKENEIPKGDSAGQFMSFNVESKIDGIYYSVTSDTKLKLVNSSCFTPDYFWRVATDECIPCPLNGYCPGGNQMYPLAGYYSNSPQDEEPKSCTPTSACKGFSAASFDSITGKPLYDFSAQCDDGYQGKLCSQCDSAYYKDQQVCRSCGLDDTARRQLILVLILALVVFTVMALGVAFVDDSKLSVYIAVIVLIQHCSFVGSVGASHISASGLSEFFQFISLLNFEIAYFKLGCSVPQITYVKVFWATVLMIVIAAIMLILASGLFALTRSAIYLAEKEATRTKVWTRRVQNSLTILGVVVYLQMTTQFFKGLFCVDLDGQSVLQVEASTVCYEGGHLATVIFIWPFLFIYSIGFPVLCCWLVLRTRSLNQWASSAAKYIYIYRGLKIRFIYFKCFNFITSFALALQITLSTTSNVTVRMATAFLFFSLDVFSIGVYWPYFKRMENLIAIGGGLANALSGLAILTILSSQSGLEEQKLGTLSGGPLFAVGLAVLVCLLLLVFPIRYLVARYFPSNESPEDDQLLLEAKYDELAASRGAKARGTLHFETKKHAKKLATVGKSVTGKLLPHVDDGGVNLIDASGGVTDVDATEIEMMPNPMIALDVTDAPLSAPDKPQINVTPSAPLDDDVAAAAAESDTCEHTNGAPTSTSVSDETAMPHALASPSVASSSLPPPLPFSLNENGNGNGNGNGHERGISQQHQNGDVAVNDSGLASPSRFASPMDEDQPQPYEGDVPIPQPIPDRSSSILSRPRPTLRLSSNRA